MTYPSGMVPPEVELLINQGAPPEAIGQAMAERGMTSDQIRVMLARRGATGRFIGFQTEGQGRLPPTFGMEMPPEQFSAELETMQRADLGIPQARMRYWGEQQAQARQKLNKWESNLKKQSPELFEVYRKGGRTAESRMEAYNKAVEVSRAEYDAYDAYEKALSVLEPYKVKVPGKEDAYQIVRFLPG